jgi:hypothetical protein
MGLEGFGLILMERFTFPTTEGWIDPLSPVSRFKTNKGMSMLDTVPDLRSLSTVRVSKATLLEKLKANRDKHRSVFEEAIEGYHKAVVEALEKALADAKAGKKYTPTVFLPEPEDHTDDYDRIIAMLEMSLDDELELPQREFSQYALDDWGWKHDFINTASAYNSR